MAHRAVEFGSLAGWTRCCAAVALLLLSTQAAVAAHDPTPAQTIPLMPLGYQPMLPEFLSSGSAMATLNYVDANHLLVTFNQRGLIKREPDDPAEDSDRMVGAFYLEMPSGKVLSSATWRTHDHSQYLWSLGNGRFLLRLRDQLSVLDPGRAAAAADALQARPLLQIQNHIVAIMVSAENDLLTVETAETAPAVLVEGDAAARRAGVQITFYRLTNNGDALVISNAGMVRAGVPLALPITTRGFLDAVEAKQRDRFRFRFTTALATTSSTLSEWDSTCYPHGVFVSQSEFVAFGCRGSADHQSIAGFNLRGDFMWQQNFYDTHVNPSFAFAPAGGRFALGRTLVTAGADPTAALPPGEIAGQEVRVYQTWNGKVLLRVTCSPAMRSGQNFALSPDGLHLALLRETQVQHKATKDDDAYTAREATVEIYDLPPLSADDTRAVADAVAIAPPDSGSRVDVALRRVAENPAPDAGNATPAGGANVQTAAASGLPNAPVAQPASALQASTPAGTTVTNGDTDSVNGEPRKPPSLYAPGEAPAGKGSSKGGQ